MVKNCVLGGLLCVVASGCGANMNTVNSLAPSAVAAPSSLSDGGQFALQLIRIMPQRQRSDLQMPWVKRNDRSTALVRGRAEHRYTTSLFNDTM